MRYIIAALILLFIFSTFIANSMTQPTTLYAADYTYTEDQYFQSIKDHIMQDWSPPTDNINGYITVTLKFRKDGVITSRKIETLSDNDKFNQYILKKISEAAPLPQIPDEFGWDSSEIGLRFAPRDKQ